MEASRQTMEQDVKPIILNIGCGWKKHPQDEKYEVINVDGFASCEPDILWNLNQFPYPWDDDSIDIIYAYHIFEHLEDWWRALTECARILKPGGTIEIRVPDASSDTALAYRDHLHIINLFSFDGVANRLGGRQLNAWANELDIVPLVLNRYARVPFAEYNWMPEWLLRFCAKHLRNFIWEQRILLIKIKLEDQKNLEFAGPIRPEIHKKMRERKTIKKEDLK